MLVRDSIILLTDINTFLCNILAILLQYYCNILIPINMQYPGSSIDSTLYVTPLSNLSTNFAMSCSQIDLNLSGPPRGATFLIKHGCLV